MAGWTKSINLMGLPGFSVQAGNGAPAAALGNVNDIYIDLQNSIIYAQKTSSGWPATGTSFKGLKGDSTVATLPNDLTPNSVTVAPVSGDNTAVSISLGNGSSILFKVDATGALTAASSSIAGNQTVGGTLKVTGATTLGATTVSSLTNQGTGIAAGLQSSINGTAAAPAMSYVGQTDTGGYLATASASAAVLGFAVNGTQAIALSKNGVSIPGTLNVTGTTTVGTLNASSVVTQNLTNTGSGSAAGLGSTIPGTASAPAFFFTAQSDTGLYLATTSTTAAVLGLTVNGTQAVALSKSGVSVPGTLNVTGGTTLASTTTGALTAASVTNNGNEAVIGNLSVQGSSTLAALNASTLAVSGASTLSGLLTASGKVTTPAIATTQAPTSQTISSTSYTVSNVTLPGSFGDGTSYPPSGLSSDSLGNVALNYQGVPVIKMANTGYSSAAANTPGSPFPTTFLSGAYAFAVGANTQFNITSTAVKFGFTANTLPVTMQALSGNVLVLQNGGSAPSYTTQTIGTVDTSGNATFSGVLKGASVTFGDGTSQTTAYTTTNANNQAKWVATSNGTTALPAFTYTNNTDTGEYLKTSSTTAAVLALSVNATDAMTLTKAGVSVPGTLTITGATSASAVTTSGLVTAANVTLSTNGKITFADGTTQTTASTSSTAGQASLFAATANGSNTAPVYSSKQYTNTGIYFNPNSTTSTNWDVAVDGTQICDWSATNAKFLVQTTGTSQTLSGASAAATYQSTNASGSSSFAGGLSVGTTLAVTGATTLSGVATLKQGSATAPGLVFNGDATTGFSTTLNPSTINVNCAGVTTASFAKTLTTIATPASVTGTVTSTTAAGTPSFVSTQGFKFVERCMYWNKSYAANALWTAYDPQTTNDGATSGAQDFRFIFPYAGSVTALTLLVGGSTTGTNTVYIYKNGSSVYTWSPGSGANSTTPYVIPFNKGAYPFAANDILTFQVANSTAGEIRYTIRAWIETGA